MVDKKKSSSTTTKKGSTRGRKKKSDNNNNNNEEQNQTIHPTPSIERREDETPQEPILSEMINNTDSVLPFNEGEIQGWLSASSGPSSPNPIEDGPPSSDSSLEDFDFLFNTDERRGPGGDSESMDLKLDLPDSFKTPQISQTFSQEEKFTFGDSQDEPPPNFPTSTTVISAMATSIATDDPMIWGTNIKVKKTHDRFRDFFLQFCEKSSSDPLYPRILRQMKLTSSNILNLNCEHLRSYEASLYKQLINYPSEILSIMDQTINEIFGELFPELKEEQEMTLSFVKIETRPYNLETVKPMRSLDPDDIEKLMCIKGMITRTSSIIPDLARAFFMCSVCRDKVEIVPENNKLSKPTLCNTCKARDSMAMIHNRCTFSDKQWIKLQEVPDDIPEGETPHTVSMFVYNDLVDTLRPGDKVSVTGIYRAIPVQNQALQRAVKAIYKTYIDIVHVKKTEQHRLAQEDDENVEQTTAEQSLLKLDQLDEVIQQKEEELRRLARSPDIYEKLIRSLAPSVWEMEDVKKGILCQLFGGTHKHFTETGLGRFRGDINVLLCGDPGTSKSQLLQYVHKIAPRGIYTSGKGSSAVGLTAYVTKDPETGEAVLESGALVLSDRGICCIDEFDKMGDTTRSVLHEAMEQQTVSVAKAGIIASLNSRTSILAVANPRESRYNPRISVVENIQLPPTLLSRFDLIYLILDKPDEKSDRRLAQHIVGLYYAAPKTDDREFIPMETLTHYIAYARKHIKPKIVDESVVNDLVKGYVEMRKMGGNRKTISATPRQLESVIRLAEAHAKMRFSSTVDRVDVSEALRLMRSAMQQAALDPRTGTIDMDLITTGKSALSRTRLAELVKELKTHVLKRESIKFDQLLKQMNEQSQVEITSSELREALKELEDTEIVALSGDYRNPIVHRT